VRRSLNLSDQRLHHDSHAFVVEGASKGQQTPRVRSGSSGY
jgi:hypothetical protein